MRARFFVGLVGLLAGPLALVGCGDDGPEPVDAGPPPTCDDGIFNGDEVDTDCGGPTCEPCGAGLACSSDADCTSGICDDTNTCERSRCNDELRNGNETDVDCGGDDCLPCTSGETCETGSDCLSQSCSEPDAETGLGTCIDPCGDGRISAGERGLDCGGVCIATCPPGTGCLDASDCDSGVCGGLICAEPACDDTVINGDESDLDCGGSCDGCAPGRACRTGEDCSSQVCQEDNTCAEPACDDGFMNGEETDVDCGGQACSPCTPGSMCRVQTDCDSFVCDIDTRICQAPTCDDAVVNGDESDIDCGGADCDGCGDGGVCRDETDCIADTCFFGGCGSPFLTEFGRDVGYVGSGYRDWAGEVCPDTTDTGTALSVPDSGRVRVAIPFDFKFYGRPVTEVFVHADGQISFDDQDSTDSPSTTIQCPPHNGVLWTIRNPVEVVLVNWTDHRPSIGGTISWEIVGEAPNRRLAITWADVTHGISRDSSLSHRAVLDEGTDIIHVCYIDTETSTSTWSLGVRSIAGINRGNGTDGISFSCFRAGLVNGQNLLYEPTGALDPVEE